MEDAIDGFIQLRNNPVLLTAFISNIIMVIIASISGIEITKRYSAVHRLVLDSARPILVWIVEISVQEFDHHFESLQIVGFLIVTFGFCIYNNLVFAPLMGKLIESCQDANYFFVDLMLQNLKAWKKKPQT